MSVATLSQNTCCMERYLVFVKLPEIWQLHCWAVLSLSLFPDICGGAISLHHLKHQLLKGLKIYPVECISAVALLFETSAQKQCTFNSIYDQWSWYRVDQVDAPYSNIQGRSIDRSIWLPADSWHSYQPLPPFLLTYIEKFIKYTIVWLLTDQRIQQTSHKQVYRYKL